MSTRVKDRKPSPIQFLATMRELVKHTWSNMKKCPKNTRFIYQTKVCDYATTCYMHLITANSIMVKTESDRLQKQKHLNDALGLINTLEALLSLVQESLDDSDKQCITDNAWLEFGRLIYKERNLILGVLKGNVL